MAENSGINAIQARIEICGFGNARIRRIEVRIDRAIEINMGTSH